MSEFDLRSIRCEDIALSDCFTRLASIQGLTIDFRYASDRNFVGRNLYGDLDCAWVHRLAAAGLLKSVEFLASKQPDWRLAVLDAVRPQRVQQQLWDHLGETELRRYVANPEKGSIHSFGMAVDVTLQDEVGNEVDMGTPFDEMSELSHPALESKHRELGRLSEHQLANRLLLRDCMSSGGFNSISTEWWHFELLDAGHVRSTFSRIV